MKKKEDKKKPADRHLDTASEANRDKHINFTALEQGDTDPEAEPVTGKLAGENTADRGKREEKTKKK